METTGNIPQFNHNSFPWDHPLPPPPPPPPRNFGFAGDGFRHHHNHDNNRRTFRNDADFHGDPSHACSKPQFSGKRKFDDDDMTNYPKLFAAPIPRTVTEDEINRLFEEHGNVVEVVLPVDRWTSQRQEYCFVKYASIEEAERAIAALNNQFALSGATVPLRLRYADKGRERLGLNLVHRDSNFYGPGLNLVHRDSNFYGPETVHKVYVNGLNREASQGEILKIFSSYGEVVDVYLMRDQLKKIRGSGFIGFSERYMAAAAINGLDKKYVMRGCDCTLTVRFAEPKRPKYGQIRATSISADVRGSNWPNALNQDNSSACTPESTGILSPTGNQLQHPAYEKEQRCQQPFSPSHLQVKQLKTLQVDSQSSCQVDSQQHTQSHLNQTSNANVEERHDSQPSQHIGDFVEASSAPFASDLPLYASCESDIPEACVDCDWSEHICPDGYKYYFNCLTCETRWEKPEEFSLYEQQLQKKWLHNVLQQEDHPSSTSEAPSCEEGCQVQTIEYQKQPSDFENPQLSISRGLEHCEEQTAMKVSVLDGPALIN